MPQPLEWTNVILPNVAFCESWVGQYHHVPLSALWSTASQWPAHQQECGQLMYYMLHTAARLMYYMTGTDRRPSNHGREKPNAAASSCWWVSSRSTTHQTGGGGRRPQWLAIVWSAYAIVREVFRPNKIMKFCNISCVLYFCCVFFCIAVLFHFTAVRVEVSQQLSSKSEKDGLGRLRLLMRGRGGGAVGGKLVHSYRTLMDSAKRARPEV